MNLIYIRASIYGVAAQALHDLLNPYIGNLSLRSRLVGYQMFHESPNLQVSVETMDDDGGGTFVLNARFKGLPEGGVAWGEGLVAVLLKADFLYDCSIEVVDENGEPVEEERNFFHPDFEARYIPR